MCNQIRELNDDSVAQVAIDHPCMHDFVQIAAAEDCDVWFCRTCNFTMMRSEYDRYKEKLNG